jgi:hypothetical protein
MIDQHDSSQANRSFVMLAPGGGEIPETFSSVTDDQDQHLSLMNQMQRLRGSIYLRDGAISSSQLDRHGRHRLPDDQDSWHLLRLRDDGSVSGCARILVHPWSVQYSQLRVASSALAMSRAFSRPVKAFMESEIARARRTGQALVEPGGWALAEDLRGSTEALSIVVGALAWAQLVGGAVGFMTATVRHGSASILRRLGGVPIHVKGLPAPAYFDPAYNCEMELLKFDSRNLNPRFGGVLDKMRELLLGAPVIATGTPAYGSMGAISAVPSYSHIQAIPVAA